MQNIRALLVLFFLTLGLASCKKYLEAKSDQRLSTPDSIEDLQALLDQEGMNDYIFEASMASDEYYVTNNAWDRLSASRKSGYLWNRAATEGISNYGWYATYRNIFNVNSVLDNLSRVSAVDVESDWNRIKGSALFIRANFFYQLTQIFAPQYETATASQEMGIVLRLNSNFNEPSVRSTVQACYAQMIKDLNEAIPLLPGTPLHKTRPGKIAAHALLTRIYLTMGDYEAAKKSADACIHLNPELLDFNTLDQNASYPIKALHPEVIFFMKTSSGPSVLPAPNSFIDSNLVSLYHEDDLRRTIFLVKNADGTHSFKNISIDGSRSLPSGLWTDEVYLSRAECYARLGNLQPALDDLNAVLRKRWRTGTFNELTATSTEEALRLILQERKKELLNRGIRWTDIRRLNGEPSFAITPVRIIHGTRYDLPPGNLRYTWLIPQEVINNSAIPQNKR